MKPDEAPRDVGGWLRPKKLSRHFSTLGEPTSLGHSVADLAAERALELAGEVIAVVKRRLR